MIPFKAHSDGKIALTLDNNAWHFFFREEIDLAKELPSDRFTITIPREVDIEWQTAQMEGTMTAANITLIPRFPVAPWK